ncbi:hypothetical protein [Paraburkholderia heleia]|uniref:hypothetical protein n=1 Tax=Paraburkholderia heleia TaxID=634127 RepID=UPI002AB6E396|nr:hypothetical protein [Paraburkholderia heleia]
MTNAMSELCAAYRCPMIAAIGVGGQWYCACHWYAPVAAFDAITAELHRQKACVDAAIHARRAYAGYASIRDSENALIELTRTLGEQYSLAPTRGATGKVIGPPAGTTGHAYYANRESETD